MPVDEVLDITFKLTEKELERLDKLAARAKKKLQSQRGGIFGGQGQAVPKSFAKKQLDKLLRRDSTSDRDAIAARSSGNAIGSKKTLDQKIDKKLEKLEKKIMLDVVNGRGEQSFLSGLFGGNTKSRLSFGGRLITNPVGTLSSLITSNAAAILGPAMAAGVIMTIIIDQIAKIDAFFKKFHDRIDNRVNALRTAEQEAQIKAGFTQIITSTSSGSNDPRDTYNSFEEFNRSRADLEARFQIRNDWGVE